MAQTRKRRTAITTPAPPPKDLVTVAVSVKFVEIAQPKMLVFKSREAVEELLEDPSAVRDAYVKLAPTIRMSERGSFDSRELREKLLSAGAAAVAVTPSVVADQHGKPEEEPVPPESLTAEQHLSAWFETVKAPKALVKAALEEALGSVQEAGL